MSAKVLLEKNGVRYQLCREADIPSVMRFFDAHWKKDHIFSRDEQLLRWQYHPRMLNLSGVAASIIVAYEQGDLIGIQGLIPTQFAYDGALYDGLWGAFLRVRDDKVHTGAGLHFFSAMHQLRRPIFAVQGNNERMQTILRMMKYHGWDDTPHWAGIIDANASAVLMGCEASMLDALMLDAQGAVPAACASLSLSGDWPRYREAWNLFRQRHLDSCGLGTLRNSDYLQWRYLDHPRFDYSLKLIVNAEAHTVHGLLVMRAEEAMPSRIAVAHIVECWADEAGRALVNPAIRDFAAAHRCALVDAYGGSDLQSALYSTIGLKPVDASTHPPIPCLFQPTVAQHYPIRGTLFIAPEVAKQHKPFSINQLIITKSDGDRDRPA